MLFSCVWYTRNLKKPVFRSIPFLPFFSDHVGKNDSTIQALSLRNVPPCGRTRGETRRGRRAPSTARLRLFVPRAAGLTRAARSAEGPGRPDLRSTVTPPPRALAKRAPGARQPLTPWVVAGLGQNGEHGPSRSAVARCLSSWHCACAFIFFSLLHVALFLTIHFKN